MTTALQATANAHNAAQSTGPKTAPGKARSAKNALRHGLRSELPVLPGECAEDWQAHRAGILGSLAPADGLETALAERVALSLWRLRRVAAYETAVTTLGIEAAVEDIWREATDPLARIGGRKPLAAQLIEAEEDLQKVRDKLAGLEGADKLLGGLSELADDTTVNGWDVWDALQQLMRTADKHYDGSALPDPEDDAWVAELGVPEDEVPDAYQWDGWTPGMVRLAWQRIAAAAKADPEKLLARAIAAGRRAEADTRARVPALEKTVKDLRRSVKVQEERQRQRRMLPSDDTLTKLSRYEAHLSRQMLQALHTLERLQAARAGQPVPPPAALDVTVDADPPLADEPATTLAPADMA